MNFVLGGDYFISFCNFSISSLKFAARSNSKSFAAVSISSVICSIKSFFWSLVIYLITGSATLAKLASSLSYSPRIPMFVTLASMKFPSESQLYVTMKSEVLPAAGSGLAVLRGAASRRATVRSRPVPGRPAHRGVAGIVGNRGPGFRTHPRQLGRTASRPASRNRADQPPGR